MQPNLFDALPPEPERRPAAASQPPHETEPPPVDESERVFASDPAHHVVLEASAGTGKTKVLVDRYVNLIASGVDPRNILAITFTRKAAAEMRDRVLTEIRRRVLDDAAFRSRWDAIKDRVADVNISTIDAFCFGLLREFPLEAGVDPAFEIADETEVPRFRAEAIELTLAACRARLLTEEPVRLLMAYKSTGQFRGALDRLLDERTVALAAVREFVARHGDADLDAVCRAFVADVRQALQRTPSLEDLFERGPGRSPRFVALVADLSAVLAGTFPATGAKDVRRLQREIEFYFTTAKGARKMSAQVFKDQFEHAADKTRHNAAIKGVAPDIEAALDRLQRGVNAVLARGLLLVLEEAVRQFDALMAQHAVLDFPAMLDRAVVLLSQQSEFARSRLKLDARYHHLLVDEFQDTSHAQWQLVELLTRTWGEGEGLNAVIPPSIFIVGDRKQSIYRFRHAEVTLMTLAAEFIESLRPDAPIRHAIRHSFRAVPELQAFVNALSAEVTSGSAIPEAFAYRDDDRFPVPAPHPGALRDGRPVLGVAADTTLADTANVVATEIKRLLDAGTVVRDRAGNRPIRPDDIAILFRSRAGHRYYEDALDARGVRTYVYKGLGFFDSPEVQDLHALLRYLAKPESNIRAAALLRSRFMRVTDAALAALAPAGIAAALRSPDFDPKSAGLAPRDEALLALARVGVQSWLVDADRVPPAELIDRIIGETAYMFELGGARLSQARENVKKVRALVRRVQNRGYATFARLADYFERLDTGEEANAIIAARGAVQLMTVHSAKGLEFPVVFLVRMNAGAGGAPPPISVVPKGAEDAPDVAISMRSPSASLESARDAEESRRLFYVAMTRARDRLYFSAEFPEEKTYPGHGSFAKLLPASLLGTLGEAVSTNDARVTWTAANGQTFDFAVCRRDPDPPQPARAPQPNALPVEQGGFENTDVPRTAATEALTLAERAPVAAAGESAVSDRALGTLVHRLFQHGVTPGPGALAWAASLITPDDLARTEAPDAVTLAERAVAMYTTMRDRADVTETLAAGRVFYEVPFSIRTGTPASVVRGLIDALVVPAEGPVIVVEFKTGAPRPEHEAQLALYREAVRAAWPGPQEVITRLFYF